ncbi:MAG: hypothetical protein CMF98_06730 [Candidatus Marinimicrobia bacterium]|nr:hypothetical protein [Candidatus Neomarinimicrobiota bacterium]MAI88727.1 hypothetical protein [Candidatus Neomarinimicrobiota bacterium]|tara:strand:+ start:447 stop:698 length:252 start_codon:yes stop_codon:yes gene_type:complete
METIHLDDFLVDGAIREKNFRQKISEIDWKQYQNKRVLIRGCSEAIVPTWAYLMITSNLAIYVSRIYFGELKSAVKIFTNNSI